MAGCDNGRKMGLSDLVTGVDITMKRKFRWEFRIPEITPEGVYAIPAIRGGRPNYSFKEYGVQGLNEEIFFPVKAEWKPITVALYDIGRKKHPIIEWITKVYVVNDKCSHEWFPSVPSSGAVENNPFKKNCVLELYDGCGGIMESWSLENAWPQSVDFGDLDYSSSEVMLVTVVLRYDRACFKKGCG